MTASLPRSQIKTAALGVFMKLVHVWYAALGFAVARWFFNREQLTVADPVARLRNSGLL